MAETSNLLKEKYANQLRKAVFHFFKINLQLLKELYLVLGDQKIDITIAHHSKIKTDPFLQLVLPTAIELK